MFKPNVLVFKTPSDMDEAARSEIENISKSSEGKISMALSGGSSPKSLYQLLLEKNKDLVVSGCVFLIGDDRLVSHEDDNSNYKMAYNSILHAVPPSHIIPIDPTPAVETANDPVLGEKGARVVAQQYAESLKKGLGCVPCRGDNNKEMSLPIIDVVLLGIGPDGHTASIFPLSPAATEEDPITSVSFPSPSMNPKVWRVTLSRFVIQNAKHVILMAAGKSKQWVIDGILADKPGNEVPISRFLRNCKGKVTFILDEECRPSASHC